MKLAALLSAFLLGGSCVDASTVVKAAPSISHLEDVLAFSITELSPHTAHPMQPFANKLKMSFQAFGEHFEHDLELFHDLYQPGTTLDFYNGDELWDSYEPARRGYLTPKGVFPRAAVLVYDKDVVHATIATETEVFRLGAIGVHDKTHAHPAVLLKGGELHASARRMVAYRQSDVEFTSEHHASMVEVMKQAPQSAAAARGLSAIDKWTDCWQGQNLGPKSMTVGMAVDRGYYQRVGGTQALVQADLEQIILDSNLVYGPQMDIYMSMVATRIQTAQGGPSWNRAPPCGVGADTQLTEFMQWRGNDATARNAAGLWHLQTDCFPPPGTVGIAYVQALCQRAYGTGLTSYLGENTWLTVAHELGHNFGADHSFENGQGRTGGIMDYGDGIYQGEYQFNRLRKNQVCSHIENTMYSNSNQLSTMCFVNGNGDGVPKVYSWTESTTKWSPCSRGCGQGYEMAEIICSSTDPDTGAVTEEPSIFCNSGSKPMDATTRTCTGRTGSCATIACETLASDPLYACDPECVSIIGEAEAGCVPAAAKRDAAFRQARGDRKFFEFRDGDFTRSEEAPGEGQTFETGYPRSLGDGWSTLEESFQSGVDAIVTREDGDVFLFKGDQFVRYSIGVGQSNGYPQLISAGFPGMSFTSDLDAAVSFPGGAYFFKGDKFVGWLDNGGQDLSIFPSGGLDIGLWGIAFRDRVDAAVYHWEAGLVDFFRNGQQVTFRFGEGEVTPPRAVRSIGRAGLGVVCPNNCDECSSATKCTKCLRDYKLSKGKPGQCTPVIYAMDLSFDDETYDATLVTDKSAGARWEPNAGNVGGGLVVGRDDYVEMTPLDSYYREFSFHCFVNINRGDVAMQLLEAEYEDGDIGRWTLVPDLFDTRGLMLEFTLKNVTVRGQTPVVPGLWKHIHADYIKGNLRVSVDAVEIKLPCAACGTGFFHVDKWRIGASEGSSNGVDGVIDQFHIDIINNLAVEDEADSGPSDDAIYTAVGMSFLASFVVIGALLFYCAKYRVEKDHDSNTCKRDAVVFLLVGTALFLMFGVTAMVAHPDIQLAFILPAALLFACALGVVGYLYHKNDRQWLWPTGSKDFMRGV
jgi:hypothetical protein